ncbi:MAG: argininosuccinate synthase [Planctomycetota bacterium]|nr:MAG: argininosuccinate synthase [Planctomycetota bacterium]
MAKKKVVLAYSGGLDTSAVIPWLKENMDCEVIAYVGDVGQGAEELEGVEEKAIKSGASACRVVDLTREFVADYVFPTLLAGIQYEHDYLLGTSIARPLIAKAQVEVAREFGADAVAHGCTGKGNDQVRFESTFSALAPDLEIIAPWRTWDLRSREDLLAYLQERNIPTTSSAKKIYSRDRNLWHISHEGGVLEDPAAPPPDDVWMMTADPSQAPDTAQDVTVEFEAGVPVGVNGERLAPEEIVSRLNTIAGEHGVGRVDILENRLVGMKSRGLYETPGGTVLVEAIKGIEQCVLDRETLHWKQQMSVTYAELVYNGRWFTPLREALSTCAAKIGERLTGSSTVRLYKGRAWLVGRSSPFSLYEESYATFSADEVYNQKHAEGFIRLLSLPERIAALKFGAGREATATSGV